MSKNQKSSLIVWHTVVLPHVGHMRICQPAINKYLVGARTSDRPLLVEKKNS